MQSGSGSVLTTCKMWCGVRSCWWRKRRGRESCALGRRVICLDLVNPQCFGTEQKVKVERERESKRWGRRMQREKGGRKHRLEQRGGVAVGNLNIIIIYLILSPTYRRRDRLRLYHRHKSRLTCTLSKLSFYSFVACKKNSLLYIFFWSQSVSDNYFYYRRRSLFCSIANLEHLFWGLDNYKITGILCSGLIIYYFI